MPIEDTALHRRCVITEYSTRMLLRRSLFVVAVGAAACSTSAANEARHAGAVADSIRVDSLARARQDSINRASPGYVIDSILPVEEELRRFRLAVGGEEVTELRNGSASREALVRRFLKDLSTRDSLDLRAATITAREFADLVYPSSPNTRPPYRLSPGFVWMRLEGQSRSGVTRALQRRGGRDLGYAGHSCNPQPEIQGENRLWAGCVVTLVESSTHTTHQRLFGTILERNGRFKFVSLANQF